MGRDATHRHKHATGMHQRTLKACDRSAAANHLASCSRSKLTGVQAVCGCVVAEAWVRGARVAAQPAIPKKPSVMGMRVYCRLAAGTRRCVYHTGEKAARWAGQVCYAQLIKCRVMGSGLRFLPATQARLRRIQVRHSAHTLKHDCGCGCRGPPNSTSDMVWNCDLSGTAQASMRMALRDVGFNHCLRAGL